MLVCLMLSQRSLKLYSFLIFFPFCCSDQVISIILSSRLLVCPSVSPKLLLIPTSLLSLSLFLSLFLFLYMVRTFNLRSSLLINFLSVQHSIVNYRYYVVQQICTSQSSCVTETLYPLNNSPPFPPPPSPWQLPFYSLIL